MFVGLTAAVVGVTEPQLQAGGGWVLLAAVGGVQQQPELQLQRVQQSLEQRVVGLIGHVHQILDMGRAQQKQTVNSKANRCCLKMPS